MPPFILALLKAGLGPIANVAISKGSEWLKEQTGIDVTSSQLGEESLLKLKQWQLENEDKLAQYNLENNKLEFQYFQEEVEDRKSAREMSMEYLKHGKENWTSVALIVICVLFIGVSFYYTIATPDLNEWAKGSITLLLGRFLGYLDNIYAFEYGTTRNNRKKDETIANLSKGE